MRAVAASVTSRATSTRLRPIGWVASRGVNSAIVVDARAKTVSLSAEGQIALDAARPRVEAADKRILALLPKGKRDGFLALLAELAGEADAAPDKAKAEAKAAKKAAREAKKAEKLAKKADKPAKAEKPVKAAKPAKPRKAKADEAA